MELVPGLLRLNHLGNMSFAPSSCISVNCPELGTGPLPLPKVLLRTYPQPPASSCGVKGKHWQLLLPLGAMDNLLFRNYRRRLERQCDCGYEKLITPLVGIGVEAGATLPLQPAYTGRNSVGSRYTTSGRK